MRYFAAAAVGLMCTAGFAQSPSPGVPPQPGTAGPNPPPALQAAATPGTAVSESSRIRAFNAGPGGQVRSIYLTNGAVVDLSSGFGPDVAAQVHKGARIRIAGSKTVVNGQTILSAQQLTIGGQSFAMQPGLAGRAGRMPLAGAPGVPPPAGGPGGPPPPPVAGVGGPPPPPPGPAGPPPPPPPANVGRLTPPPPPPGGRGHARRPVNGAPAPVPPAGTPPNPNAAPPAAPAGATQDAPAPPTP